MNHPISLHDSKMESNQPTYEDYVRALLPTYPQLQVLHDFIGEDQWNEWNKRGHPKTEGLTKVSIVIVDLKKECESKGHIVTPESATSLRLYLAQDLSKAVIEYFGSTFNLDPHVFEAHVRGHERMQCGRPLFAYQAEVHPSSAPVSDRCTAPYIDVSFPRPYVFADGGPHAWKIVQAKRWKTANVMRHMSAYLGLKASEVLYSLERFTVAFLDGGGVTSRKAALIMFDPMLPLASPSSMGGYRNFTPVPEFKNFESNAMPVRSTHRPLRDDFVDWLRHLEESEISAYVKSFSSNDLSVLGYLFRVAIANLNNSVREVHDTMEYIENKMHAFWRFGGWELTEELACDCTQILRYFAMDFAWCVTGTLEILKGRFQPDVSGIIDAHLQAPGAATPAKPRIPCERLISDFEAIALSLRNLKRRSETDIQYFVARLSAKEARKAQEQAEQASLLNYLVYILGPLSLLASVLAIEDDREKYLVAFPFVLVAAVIFIVSIMHWARIRSSVGALLSTPKTKKMGQPTLNDDPFDYLSPKYHYRSD